MATKAVAAPQLRKSKVAFEMHQNLLMHTIKRQAGSLEKAVLEAVMNSIDAGATRIMVDTDPREFCITIRDNGKGIGGTHEIEEYFKKFGTPHAEGDATFGEFRMGRGQLFAFGRNSWTSGTHQLDVDIEKNGLTFDWFDLPENYAGCCIRIWLYNKDKAVLDRLRHDLAHQVKYAEVQIDFNGDPISSPASKQTNWDGTTDSFYLRYSDGSAGVSVYQLGVYVENIPKWTAGVSGIAVSRKKMKLNYARNQVMRDCPIFKEIIPALKKLAPKEEKVLTKFDVQGRIAKLHDFMVGAQPLDEDGKKMQVITDINGKAWSFNQLMRLGATGYSELLGGGFAFSFSSPDDILADTIMRQKRCIIFDESILDDLHLSRHHAKEFFTRVFGDNYKLRCFHYRDIKTLEEEMEDSKTIIPASDYTAHEKRMLAFARKVGHSIRWGLRTVIGDPDACEHLQQDRFLQIGLATTEKAAWTDGRTYVVFDRRFLERTTLSPGGLWSIVWTLAHEYCHDQDDSSSMQHSEEFFETFHDLTSDTGFLGSCHRAVVDALENKNDDATPPQ